MGLLILTLDMTMILSVIYLEVAFCALEKVNKIYMVRLVGKLCGCDECNLTQPPLFYKEESKY